MEQDNNMYSYIIAPQESNASENKTFMKTYDYDNVAITDTRV